MRPSVFFGIVRSVVLLTASLISPARDAQTSRLPVDIHVLFSSTGKVGQRTRLVVSLTTQDGQPLSEKNLGVFLNSRLLTRDETDLSGIAVFVLPATISAGTYSLGIVYRGGATYQAVRTKLDLMIEPAWLTVSVLPPLAGVDFEMDGKTFSSGHDGVARIQVNRPGEYPLVLLPLEAQPEGRQALFSGWDNGSEATIQTVLMAGNQNLQAGFEFSYLANFSFKNPTQIPVSPARITSLEISSSTGLYRILDPAQPVWLEANIIFHRLSGLDSVAVVHSVQEVLLDGSNVVNRGQQRFILHQNGDVQLDLLLYDAVFTAQDFLFAQPIGDELELTFPDESVRVYPLDSHGQLSLYGLARGSYQARLLGERGLTLDLPIVLSRNQEIRLPALTVPDILATAGLVVITMTSLFLAGRLKTYWKRMAGAKAK